MNLDDVLTHLARDPHAEYDVAEVALHLARDEYPQLDVAAYLDQLRDLARDAQEYMGHDSASRVVGLCKHLFHQIGYHGNQKEYYDPRNSYLNDVMDRLTGIPISLSVLVIAVGRRAGLPLVGLGLPGHFVVKCEGTEPPVILDPFHGGRCLSVEECEAQITRVTGASFRLSPVALEPIPLALLVERMLNNLRGIYLKSEDWRRACRTLTRLHQLNPTDAQVRRDLGLCLMEQRQPGKAIDHLGHYLQAAPEAKDHPQIEHLWHVARRAVGRWN